MGILFGLFSSKEKKINEEYSLTLSHGTFHEVAEVGEKVGMDMSNFLKIGEYSEIQYTEIKLDDIKEFLEICGKTLQAINEYSQKTGEILLSHNELIEYEKFLHDGQKVTKEDFEGTTGRLKAFIRLCEEALKSNEMLVIEP